MHYHRGLCLPIVSFEPRSNTFYYRNVSCGSNTPPPLPLIPEGSVAGSPTSANAGGGGQQKSAGGRVANKVCRVCGDKALGYNFNVVTCESCKAFFRRNALAEKDFRCPFDNNCNVNVVSRRMCQKCRLKKCFDVGMKKEWILSDDAKRKKKTERRKRPPTSSTVKDDTSNPEDEPCIKKEHLANELNNSESPSLDVTFPSPPKQSFECDNEASQMMNVGQEKQGQEQEEGEEDLSAESNCFPERRQGEKEEGCAAVPSTSTRNAVEGIDLVELGTTTVETSRPHQSSTSASSSSRMGVSGFGGGNPPQTLQQKDHICIPRNLIFRLLQNPENFKSELEGFFRDGDFGGLTTKKCTCTCSCGFYPEGTKLGPPPPSSSPTLAKHSPLMHDKLKSGDVVKCEPASNCSAGPSTSTSPLLPSSASQLISPAPSNMSNMGWIPPDLAGVELSADLSGGELESIYGTMIDAAISSEFTASPSQFSIPASPMTPGMSSGPSGTLSTREQRKLDELISANEIMKQKMDTKISKDTISLTDVVNMTDIAIRRIIQMCKRIQAFRSLCQEDQIALLKGSCTELMILRGLMNYDPEKDSWIGPSSEETLLKCDVFKSIKGDVYGEHKRYLNSFPASWRTDEGLMLLLGVIVLFSPSRPHIQHVDFIKKQQEMYYSLLKRYLCTQTGSSEADKTWQELVKRIAHLHSLNEALQKIFLNVNPKDVEPLLIEIFDLK